MKALLAGISALLLTAGLSLLLSHFQVQAQPASEVTAADLNVIKSVHTDTAAPGEILTYTIRIWNDGDAVSAWMTDTLVEELTYVPGSLQKYGPGNASVANGVITWTYDMFGWGQEALITFSAQISSEIGYGTIVNTAQVTGAGTLIEDSSTTVVAGQVVNLDAAKIVNSSTAVPGDVLIYTIQIANNDVTPLSQVRLTDVLQPGLIYVPYSLQLLGPGDVGYANGVITWTVPTLAGFGQTAIITFSAQVSPDLPDDGWVTNTAHIAASGYQTLTLEPATTYVQRTYPHLEASKSVYPSQARPGEYLTFTVRITNTGDGVAETIWMTDDLPSAVVYQTGAASRGSFGEANGVITWNVSLGPSGTLLLPSQGEAAITFTVQVSPAWTANITFINTAEITGAGTLVQAQVSARVIVTSYMYLPLVFRRWPPIPYAPYLPAIDNPDEGFNDYTVSWSHDHPDVSVISYTLEEATNESFTGAVTRYSILHTGVENSREFIDQPDGTYYYRVRGHNEYGPGAWSDDIRSVTIFTVYYDSFDNSNSGWPNEKGPIEDDQGEVHGYWHRRYHNGQYRIYIEQPTCWTCGWFYQPDAFAPYSPPTDKYCVETKVKFEEGAYWASMGLIFGANEANRKIYALCLSRGSDEDTLGGFLMRKDDYSFPMRGCSGPTAKIEIGSSGTSRYNWNRLQVGVDGDQVTVYMGGIYIDQWTMSGLSNMTRVGVIGGDYEILPVDIRYAYFRVIPNSDCSP